MVRPRKPPSPFRYSNSSPEVIRLVVLMYVRYPLLELPAGLAVARASPKCAG